MTISEAWLYCNQKNLPLQAFKACEHNIFQIIFVKLTCMYKILLFVSSFSGGTILAFFQIGEKNLLYSNALLILVTGPVLFGGPI